MSHETFKDLLLGEAAFPWVESKKVKYSVDFFLSFFFFNVHSEIVFYFLIEKSGICWPAGDFEKGPSS